MEASHRWPLCAPSHGGVERPHVRGGLRTRNHKGSLQDQAGTVPGLRKRSYKGAKRGGGSLGMEKGASVLT